MAVESALAQTNVFSIGSNIEAFSYSQQSWVPAEVVELAEADIDVAQGLTAGSVRVRYTSGCGIKWVSPKHAARVLRLTV